MTCRCTDEGCRLDPVMTIEELVESQASPQAKPEQE